jgi:peptidoglycan/xylan/chitin deacetylase (PgdA/CDA1 family)
MPPRTEPAGPDHRILLTFDDGPHVEHTVSLLDELARRRLSAVFFVLGERLERPAERAIAERAVREGHFIGNHGYWHLDLTELADDEIRSSFQRAEAAIGDLDRGVKLWRPPWGRTEARIDAALASLGYTRMLWNVNSWDWRENAMPEEWIRAVISRIRARMRLGFGNTVCLFHDLEATAARLGAFLDELAKIPDARLARYDPCHPEGLTLEDEPAFPGSSTSVPGDAFGFDFAGVRVLVRPRRSAVYMLNDSAGLMWDVLAEGASEAETARCVARHYGISEELAARDLRAAVADWRISGLLGPKAPEMEDPGPWQISTDVTELPDGAALGTRFEDGRSYRLLDFCFDVRFENTRIAGAVHPRFANLEAAGSARCNRVFDVASHPDAGYYLNSAGDTATRHESLAALTYHFFFAVMRHAHPGLDLMACLHSAFLSCGEAGIALIANNGSGKSTLTAALAKSGMSAHSDDRLFLDFASGRPIATPNAIGLKRGSWTAVESRYPGILELPSVDTDGEEVRFLLPPAPAERLLARVTHIFFPCYDASADTCARTIGRVDALRRITASEGWISSEPERLGAFLRWLECAACYELPFSNLDQAVSVIQACLRDGCLRT